MHIEPGLYPSIVDIVIALNDKIRKGIGAQKYEYNEIYVSVDKIAQKIAIHFPEDHSVFIIQSADLSNIFGCDLEQNQTGVIMKEKRPHYMKTTLKKTTEQYMNYQSFTYLKFQKIIKKLFPQYKN